MPRQMISVGSFEALEALSQHPSLEHLSMSNPFGITSESIRRIVNSSPSPPFQRLVSLHANIEYCPVERLAPLFGNLRELRLCVRFSLDVVAKMIAGLPNLRLLSIHQIRGWIGRGFHLVLLAMRCPQLESLSLSEPCDNKIRDFPNYARPDDTILELMASLLPELRYISIRGGSYGFTQASLASLNTHCAYLEDSNIHLTIAI